MATRIELKDAGVFFDRLGKRQKEAALRGLQSAGARAVQVVVAEIIPSRTPEPVDRGTYKAGWRWEPTKDGAVVENLEPHAPMIEGGVRAENVKIGARMFAALQEWAARHGFEDPLGAAWGIAKAIKKRGIWGSGLGIWRELNERLRGPDGIVAEEVRREVERA